MGIKQTKQTKQTDQIDQQNPEKQAKQAMQEEDQEVKFFTFSFRKKRRKNIAGSNDLRKSFKLHSNCSSTSTSRANLFPGK